jgi:hypothetical protein
MSLLSVNADAKTIKGVKRGYLTGVMYLAPARLSGKNVCPDATPGCIADCLNTAGRGVFSNVQKARIAKTNLFFAERDKFMADLEDDIDALIRKASRQNMIPLVRLNGTSDIAWESVQFNQNKVLGCRIPNIMSAFPMTQFYDYTKSFKRMMRFLKVNGQAMPRNYHLTFSLSECNKVEALNVLFFGGNVAVVFSTKKGAALPKTWEGYRVIDGDRDDIRHRDNSHSANGASSIRARGVVIGLRAKGRARKDTSGFVVQV